MIQATAEVGEAKPAPGPFRYLIVGWLLLYSVLAPGAELELLVRPRGAGHAYIRPPTEDYFLIHQDAPLFVLCFGATLVLAYAPAHWLARLAALRVNAGRLVLGLAICCLAVGVAGHWVVFEGYTLSLDEFLANFDAKIFAHGQLLAPTPPDWRPYLDALQPLYMLPVPGGEAWASSYLPINAGLRALFRLAHAEPLVNPLLSAVSIVAVYAVGRRLWPARPQIALIAAALTGVSAQVLVMAMTAYAMPAHLAFNLVWLWLFLRGGRLGHGGALVVGFLATGIHQLLFHPMFAAPFVLRLWLDRRWALASLYTLAYGAIGLFWIEYWQIALHFSGFAPQAADSVGADWFAERVNELMDTLKPSNLTEMAQSLVRFFTWQNPLLAPLLVTGAWPAFRAGGALRAMLLGIVLTLVAMAVAVPSQVNGWGYRYMHGLLGSAALIAAWTWDRFTNGLSADRRAAASGALVISCAVSLLVLAPIRAWQAWRYSHPYAVADAAIRRVDADVVLVDHADKIGFDPNTLVRNDPYLRNRPKVMSMTFLTGDGLRALCAQHSVAVFTSEDAARFGIDVVRLAPDPHLIGLRQLMGRLHCGRPFAQDLAAR